MNDFPGGAQGHGMSKDKKQLIVLGALGVVLAGVLSSQFGGEDGASAAAGTVESPAVVQAQTTAPSAAPEVAGETADENPALTSDGIGVRKNPFASFWAAEETSAPVQEAPLVPPPSITVNGTLTSGKTPIAILNGQVRRIGEQISGWTLVAIDARSVQLRSPTGSVMTANMPLLPGAR